MCAGRTQQSAPLGAPMPDRTQPYRPRTQTPHIGRTRRLAWGQFRNSRRGTSGRLRHPRSSGLGLPIVHHRFCGTARPADCRLPAAARPPLRIRLGSRSKSTDALHIQNYRKLQQSGTSKSLWDTDQCPMSPSKGTCRFVQWSLDSRTRSVYAGPERSWRGGHCIPFDESVHLASLWLCWR